tara:strand:+ start:89 stop:319 length:231 start_codon:yes stop_codon:yes gene_type:complete
MFELGSEKIDKECGRFRESGGYPQKLMTTQRGKKPSSKDNPSQNSISRRFPSCFALKFHCRTRALTVSQRFYFASK